MATQEYYGYLPPSKGLDLGKLATDLSKTISGIGERRELEKEQLDQIQADNTKIINDADLGKSQTFQTMALNGTQKGVQFINQLNKQLKAGQLSPKEYKQKMNTVMENWGTFANTVKTFDARMSDIQKQQADGKASGIGISANEFFAQSSELKDKEIFIDDNGNMSMGRIDPMTGQLDPDSIQSVRSMALPNNMVFDKVNLDEQVSEVVKTWKPWIGEKGQTTIEDIRNNPDYARKMADFTGALTSNPRLTASILVDNTGDNYDVYFNQADYNNKINQMIQTENNAREFSGIRPMNKEEQNEFAQEASGKLIEMRKDATDTYQPVITEAQLRRAKNAIEATVGVELGQKVTEDEGGTRSYGGGGRVGSTEKPMSSQTVDDIRKKIISGDYPGLTQFTVDGKYKFKQGSGQKLEVIKVSTENGRTKEESLGEVEFKNAGRYFGFTNLDKWREYIYDSQNRIPGTSKSGSNNMTPDQWNAKWATLKKGQKMVGLDGKTYTKQ
jgi:hypothetical protein